MASRQKLSFIFSEFSIFLRGHLFNPIWHSRLKRRTDRYRIQYAVLSSYFRKYYLPIPLPEPEQAASDSGCIYSIWLQGEENAPANVKACFDSIRRHCRRPLVVLDEKSLRTQTELPETIWNKYRLGKIRPAHFADICRVDLLFRNGGVWMDSTLFATRDIPEWVEKENFFVYLTPSHYGGIQNCFIRSLSSHPLLGMWRAAILSYWMQEDAAIDYFQHQVMFRTIVENIPQASELFASMLHKDQEPTHRLWWKYRDAPFSDTVWNNETKDAFFQKTNCDIPQNPIPGSFYDHIINDRTL